MRIARFSVDGQVAFAAVEGGDLAVIDTHPFGQITFTGARVPIAGVRLLPPILPSKVVAIGKNYAAHAREMGGDPPDEPVMFLKPSTAVIGPLAPVARPADVGRVDYEGELAVVIGRLARDVPAATALDVVLGYTCANDVTARDQQLGDGQWTRGKGYDTFCPLGPWIETDLDPSDLLIETTVNGEVRQSSRTSLMLHDVAALIEHVSRVMTLLPGDVLLTGTPEGIGPVVAGDEMTVSIEGVGSLTNPVVDR